MKIEWGKLKFEGSLDFDDILAGFFAIAGLSCVFALIASVSCGIYTELHPERYGHSVERTVITNGK